MSPSLRTLTAGILVVLAAGCVRVYPPPESTPSPPSGPAQSSAESADESDEPESPFDEWDEVLEDTREIPGYFTVHRKRDNTVYLELPSSRLGSDFGMVMHIDRGVGDFNLQQGLPLSEMRLMRFRRVGDDIQLVHMNPRFRAEPGSALELSMSENVGHSVVASFDIESEHEETKNVLIDATDFFASDYANVAQRIRFYFGDRPPSFQGDRSFVSDVMGFPENVEIDVELTFESREFPRFGGAGVSDYRSIPVGVRYSIVKLPDDPMMPRLADDRVGYFLTAHYDFARDRKETSFVRQVNRWRLEKQDPQAEMSEPVEPIVYYIDRSVPERYREYVKQGIEAWQKAFEAAGFRNAIVARMAPDDSTWSAEDARYSTVRWTAGYNMGYAIGPSQVDPRTGEILNADVLIAATWPKAWLSDWQERVDPRERIRRHEELQRMMLDMPRHAADALCMAAEGKAHQLAMQYGFMLGQGVLKPGEPMPEAYIGDGIRDLVMHEVGHTLGLRHNFKSSAGVPLDRLHDTEFTRRNGVSVSVMDYNPVNVAVDPDEQGHYYNMEVGSYDVWAIQYGYAPVYEQSADAPFSYAGELATTPEAERVGLRKIAEEATDPLHVYGTDEDNWLGPYAVDPLTNGYDLSRDPLGWARNRVALLDRVQPRLEATLIEDGEAYPHLRGAISGTIFERYISLLPVTKSVGGLHHVRFHKGDPNGEPPFTPVPAERQREAVRVIVENAFAEDAFAFTPELLNKLAPSRWSHWGQGMALPVDFPVHSMVGFVQSALLGQLLAPARLSRMLDNEVRMPGGGEAYRLSELFETLTGAIWDEVLDGPRSVDSFRRNLQRSHLDALTTVLLDTGPESQPSPPEDARSLARLHLMEIADAIDAALDAGAGLDTYTRAHLLESGARIERALEASVTVGGE